MRQLAVKHWLCSPAMFYYNPNRNNVGLNYSCLTSFENFLLTLQGQAGAAGVIVSLSVVISRSAAISGPTQKCFVPADLSILLPVCMQINKLLSA